MAEELGNSLDSILTPIESQEDEVVQVVEEDIPDKYKGKSPKEIIAMHQEAEKLIGKQGSEVGDLRKIVDDFIKAQVSKESTTITSEDDDFDFYDDPKKAVAQAIEKHPIVKEAKDASLALRRTQALDQLKSKHPDFMDTVQNDKFVEWIKGSKVRMELFTRAETQFDVEAADELFSTWAERTKVNEKVAETAKADRDSQLKAAGVTSTGSSESVGKKVYRRADIINLMKTDPKRYAALSDDILKAYAEGRVK